MHESKMEQMWRSGHISGGNASYVEELYEKTHRRYLISGGATSRRCQWWRAH